MLDAASWVPSSSEENLSDKGDFSLGVNMGGFSLHSPKTLSDEGINRGPVSAHTHSIARTQKILAFML